MKSKKLENQFGKVGQELGQLDIQAALEKLDFPGIYGKPVSLNPLSIPPIQRYKIVPKDWQDDLQKAGLSINESRGRGEKIKPEEIAGINKKTRGFIESAGQSEEGVHFASSTQRIARFESSLDLLADKVIKYQYVQNLIDKIIAYYEFPGACFTLTYTLCFKSYNPQCYDAAKEKDVFNFLMGGNKIDFSREVFFLEEHLKILHTENMVSFYKWLIARIEQFNFDREDKLNATNKSLKLARDADYKSLKESFITAEAFCDVMNKLVSRGILDSSSFTWIDRNKIYKSRAAALIYHLSLNHYFNFTPSVPTASHTAALAKDGFDVDVKARTCLYSGVDALRSEFSYIKAYNRKKS